MSRPIAVLFFGLAALGVLTFFCIRECCPAIEADLGNRARSVLEAGGMGWAAVFVDGRDLVLTGTAPAVDLRDQAADIAREVRGIRTVDNQLALPQAIPVTPSPYVFSAEYDGKTVVLGGYVPDRRTRSMIVLDAEKRFGASSVENHLQIAPGSPNGWSEAIRLGILARLDRFQEASAKLVDTNLVIDGRTSSPDLRRQIREEIMKSKPAHFSLRFNVVIPEQGSPGGAAGICQERFNDLLSERRIEFKTGRVSISSESYELFDDLLSIADECPGTRIRVEGHTDSHGADLFNQDLSLRRARAVVDFLVSQGLGSSRLMAVGYGESRPIADNATPEGRSRNRRIEIKVLEE